MNNDRKIYYKTVSYALICQKYKKYIEEHILTLYKEGCRAYNQERAFDYTRLIFPLIDSFNPLFKKAHRLKGNNKQSRALLLQKLKVKDPYLIWHLYRDKVTHNDYFGMTLYHKTLILPQWSMDDNGFTYFDEYESSSRTSLYQIGERQLQINTVITLTLNPYFLAQNFISFLEKEAVNHSTVEVKKEVATKLFSKSKTNLQIINDIRNILELFSRI